MEHRGEIVSQVLRQKGINLTQLAPDLGIRRQTLYNQLDMANMKTTYILKIGELIGVDFTELIPSLKKEILNTTEIQEEERPDYGIDIEPLSMMVTLDGTIGNLEKLFHRLTKINEALRAL